MVQQCYLTSILALTGFGFLQILALLAWLLISIRLQHLILLPLRQETSHMGMVLPLVELFSSVWNLPKRYIYNLGLCWILCNSCHFHEGYICYNIQRPNCNNSFSLWWALWSYPKITWWNFLAVSGHYGFLESDPSEYVLCLLSHKSNIILYILWRVWGFYRLKYHLVTSVDNRILGSTRNWSLIQLKGIRVNLNEHYRYWKLSA